jgi:hypothetical protein
MPINIAGSELTSVGAKVLTDGGLVTSGLTNVWDFGLNTCYPGSGTTLNTLTTSTQAWTLTNGPTYSTLGGGSLLFDGSNDYLAYTNAFYYTLNTPATTIFWIKTSSSGGGLMSHYSGGPVNSAMFISSGKLSYQYYNGSWRDIYGTGTSVNTNNWVMVAYAAPESSGGTIQTYVNGIADWSFTVTGGHYGSQIGSIGSRWGYDYFNGYMGQILQYNGTQLSASQILQVFNATRQRYGV